MQAAVHMFLEQHGGARVVEEGPILQTAEVCADCWQAEGVIDDVSLIVTSPFSSAEVTSREVKGPVPFNFPFWEPEMED